MESHGQVGSIQVSERTADLLEAAFVLEPRGEPNVKGKGKMTPYFLISERETAEPPQSRL